MTTTERIVESYYRLIKECFTMLDVKVKNGNNRQFDLLAYCLPHGDMPHAQQYHVEITVMHGDWGNTLQDLKLDIDRKFFGNPASPADIKKSKSFLQNIKDTYESVGFIYEAVRRVWVCWTKTGIHKATPNQLLLMLDDCCKEHCLNPGMITVVSFRDEILKDLLQEVEGASYQDDALRTLSLVQKFIEHQGDLKAQTTA
jgi:hypothetical protein